MANHTSGKQKRGFYYSQPALGIGQLMRSLYICESLVKYFEIDFFLGTPAIDRTLDSPNFHLHLMPPLWLQEWEEPPQLVDPTGQHTVEQVFELRRNIISRSLNKSYDFVITELYPFSKQRFEAEIEMIIAAIKSTNPQCIICSSLRDTVFVRSEKQKQWILNKVRKYYDVLLVHSDPWVISFNETFGDTREIEDKLIYTGYVADPVPRSKPAARKKQIITSIGSGAYGIELPLAVCLQAQFFPDYKFIFILGPKAPTFLKTNLESTIQNLNLTNTAFYDFRHDFYQLLEESALSINLGGSTVIDMAATQTPALVYPMAHVEHVFRALKFASNGVCRLLLEDDLHPNHLTPIIKEALTKPYKAQTINVNGSEATAWELKKRLDRLR